MTKKKKDKFDEIREHWLESTLMPVGTSEDTRAITEEFNCAVSLMMLRKTMIEVARSKGTLFAEVRCRKTKAPRLETSALGHKLVNCCLMDVWAIKKTYPRHRFDPYFELFFDAYTTSPLMWLRKFHRSTDDLNALVEKLRAGAKEKGFLKTVAKLQRAAAKNAAGLVGFVDKLFAGNSKLLVVRVDFGYVRERDPVTGDLLFDVPDVQRHRRLIFRWIKRKFPTLVGYIWKLEYGSLRSFHVHAALFFNGQKSRQGITIGRTIGEHWRDAVTKGRGNFWNVNRFERDYELKGLRGIGLISHSDDYRRDKLMAVLRYLAKVDYFVRIESDKIGRTFGKSVVKQPTLDARGRKRLYFPPKLRRKPGLMELALRPSPMPRERPVTPSAKR